LYVDELKLAGKGAADAARLVELAAEADRASRELERSLREIGRRRD
jgi:hypothetical protein